MRIITSIYWWAATLVVLFILDDILFGWIFWAIAAISINTSVAVAFVVSFAVQVWLSYSGIRERPGPIASKMINRLFLGRSSPNIEKRELKLRHSVMGVTAAIIVTPLIGGVIPVIMLSRTGRYTQLTLRKISVALAGLYAVEFCLIHGGYGIPALLRLAFGAAT